MHFSTLKGVTWLQPSSSPFDMLFHIFVNIFYDPFGNYQSISAGNSQELTRRSLSFLSRPLDGDIG